MKKRLFSAVVDPTGDYLIQARNLVWSLKALAGVDGSEILLHVVGLRNLPVVPSLLNDLNVELIHVDPFFSHPYCNKLQQLSALKSRNFDDVVLLDCDLIVLEDFPKWSEGIQAKAVDVANPPFDTLVNLFNLAGLNLRVSKTDFEDAPTVWGNSNGGVYIIPQKYFSVIADAWVFWAAWCMDHVDVFGDYWRNVDQVSFSMALSSSSTPFKVLDRRFNFPTHIKLDKSYDCYPAVLHYHRAVIWHQGKLYLLPVEGLDLVSEAIDTVNLALAIEYAKKPFLLDNIG
jgi:hypothetical protein